MAVDIEKIKIIQDKGIDEVLKAFDAYTAVLEAELIEPFEEALSGKREGEIFGILSKVYSIRETDSQTLRSRFEEEIGNGLADILHKLEGIGVV